MPGRRIVLLEMSTEDAEDFVRTVHEHGEAFSSGFGDAGVKATVEAVVARPTVWCRCDVPTETRYQRRRRQAQKREGGWTRGKTLGWWMCVQCHKPSRPVVKHWVSSMLAGANDLLPKILGEGEPLSPSERWDRDGGGRNVGADANSAHVRTQAGESRQSRKRATKQRRSDKDREAALARFSSAES